MIIEDDDIIDSYIWSLRWAQFTTRNKMHDKFQHNPILGWEPYNNLDALFTGDNARMMYWEMREPVIPLTT